MRSFIFAIVTFILLLIAPSKNYSQVLTSIDEFGKISGEYFTQLDRMLLIQKDAYESQSDYDNNLLYKKKSQYEKFCSIYGKQKDFIIQCTTKPQYNADDEVVGLLFSLPNKIKSLFMKVKTKGFANPNLSYEYDGSVCTNGKLPKEIARSGNILGDNQMFMLYITISSELNNSNGFRSGEIKLNKILWLINGNENNVYEIPINPNI